MRGTKGQQAFKFLMFAVLVWPVGLVACVVYGVAFFFKSRVVASVLLSAVAAVLLSLSLLGTSEFLSQARDVVIVFSAFAFLTSSLLITDLLIGAATNIRYVKPEEWPATSKFVRWLLDIEFIRIKDLRLIAESATGNFGLWLSFYMAAVFGGLTWMVYVIDKDSLFEGLLLAIVVVSFLRIEWPTLVRPNFIVSVHDSPNLADPRLELLAARSITIRSGETKLVIFRVTNIGLSAWRYPTVWLCFSRTGRGDGFEIVAPILAPNAEPGQELYEQVRDLQKNFVIQRHTNCAYLRRLDLVTQPGGHILIPVVIRAPAEPWPVRPKVEVQVTSDGSWGLTTRVIAIENRNALAP